MALSKPSTFSLHLLASARILVGASTLLFPMHSSFIFGLTPSLAPTASTPVITLIGRLFGVRDGVLGGFLWTSLRGFQAVRSNELGGRGGVGKGGNAETEPLTGSLPTHPDANAVSGPSAEAISHAAKIQLTNALYLGLICDSIDVLSCLACIVNGDMTVRAEVLTAGGALLFACIGFAGIRGLRGW